MIYNKQNYVLINISTVFCIEPYLKNIEDPYIRKALTCFRLCAHRWRVETGRYKRIDKENGTCLICNSQEIGHVFHFMMNAQNIGL